MCQGDLAGGAGSLDAEARRHAGEVGLDKQASPPWLVAVACRGPRLSTEGLRASLQDEGVHQSGVQLQAVLAGRGPVAHPAAGCFLGFT